MLASPEYATATDDGPSAGDPDDGGHADSARRSPRWRLLGLTGRIVTAGPRADLAAAPWRVAGAEVEVLVGKWSPDQAGNGGLAAVVAEDSSDQLSRAVPDARWDGEVERPELGLESSLTRTHNGPFAKVTKLKTGAWGSAAL